MEQIAARLEQMCQAKGLKRFAPEQILELLADGETAEWIAGQLLPAGAADPELLGLLEEAAAVLQPAAPAAGVGIRVRRYGGTAAPRFRRTAERPNQRTVEH